MTEIAFIQDARGRLTIEGMDETQLNSLALDLLPAPAIVNCGRPLEHDVPWSLVRRTTGSLRVHRIYHDAVCEGPGVRSVLQVQGCPIRCAGCYVPETHAASGGVSMSTRDAMAELFAAGHQRDGVTILGGEPLAQALALTPVLRSLVALGCHIVLYTGYTVERVRDHGTNEQRRMLHMADIVIDGPFVQALAGDAGEWRGSRNQRLLGRSEVRSILGGAGA